MTEVLEHRWTELCNRLDKVGYASLSRDEKLFFNIRMMIDSTNNGGLISYFYNSYADTIVDCMDSLDRLDAAEVKEQIQIVCRLFPDGVPTTIEARNLVINSWSNEDEIDTKLEEVDEMLLVMLPSLESKLVEYLQRRIFVS